MRVALFVGVWVVGVGKEGGEGRNRSLGMGRGE